MKPSVFRAFSKIVIDVSVFAPFWECQINSILFQLDILLSLIPPRFFKALRLIHKVKRDPTATVALVGLE